MPVRTARSLAIFMGLMTIAWSVLGLHAYPLVAAIGAVLGAAIALGAVVTARRGAPAPAPPSPGTGEAKARQVFRIAVALETVAILAAIVVLNKTGHPEFIMPSIALAVALHFFVFLVSQPRFALHVVAGTVGTVGAVTAIVLMATSIVGAAAGHAIAGGALALCTLAYGLTFLRVVMSNTTGRGRN
ncbi:hypothetical protein [Tsukamurella pseudospumae]|uniref:Uncharacterized protein n=1 Tax=Tsukamurella pseudospumae TaxID=239498 RepID=A0A138AHX8_9ACTN|nr:hypothetical protein [Tsukamurella pseudospumae]KXP10098.1 hypothetical protein AXK60_06315 [Tsukamurella pseudospumae]